MTTEVEEMQDDRDRRQGKREEMATGMWDNGDIGNKETGIQREE